MQFNDKLEVAYFLFGHPLYLQLSMVSWMSTGAVVSV